MTYPMENALRTAIEEFFGGGRCFLTAKGRVGLYLGLRALGLPPGSKVLMPGYTCVVVPLAVQFAGLTSNYVDIDPRSYNLDPSRLQDIPDNEVSAIIVQHTYGLPADLPQIKRWADARGIPLIEDCCHTFGTRIDGQLCGTFGAFSFMSGQWNKPFSTGLGGMLLVNDPALADRVEEILHEEASSPGPMQNKLLAAQALLHRLTVRPATTARITAAYRALSQWGLLIGSSGQEELQGVRPQGYVTRMAPCQVGYGLREMSQIDENIRHRTRLTEFYQRELANVGFEVLPGNLVRGVPLLRYPVRVANKAEFLSRAAASGLEIGNYFDLPLHQATAPMRCFGYRDGSCPNGEAACGHVVNLPTHRRVSERVAERTLRFLARHAQPVRRERSMRLTFLAPTQMA